MTETSNRFRDSRRRLWKTTILATILLAVVPGCDRDKDTKKPVFGQPGQSVGPPTIAISNYPLMFFAEQIAGEHIQVRFPFAEQQSATADEKQTSPASWTPSGKAIAAMQSADKVIVVGAGYEPWLQFITLSESSIVRTSDAFKSKWIKLDDQVAHQHGPDGQVDEGANVASKTWLDLSLATQQAQGIRDACSDLVPKHKAEFEANFQTLSQQLADLQKQFDALAADLNGASVMVLQPSLKYFAANLNLENLPTFNFESNQQPDEKTWQRFDEMIQQQSIRIVLCTPETDPEIRKRIQASGVAVIPIATLDAPPATGDLLSHMRMNIENFKTDIPKQ